jgi:hypothetical protein
MSQSEQHLNQLGQ